MFVEWADAPDDSALGVVPFAIFPHLDAFPTNTMAAAERWAAGLGGLPAFAIDEQTAIVVAGGAVEVVSEGEWLQLGGPGAGR
jgi:dipeptidase E